MLHKNGDFGRYLDLAWQSYNISPHKSEYPDAWLKIADENYAIALRLLNLTDLRGAGFFLHQSLENYFKAYLIRQGWRARREHNLGNLLNHALRYDETLESYWEVCEFLNICYLDQLYPHYLWKDTFPNPPAMDDVNVRDAAETIAPLTVWLRARSASTL